DANVDGKPYGLDIVMPAKIAGDAQLTNLDAMIPDEQRRFVEKVLERFGVPPLPPDAERPPGITAWMHSFARAQVETALRHPIKLIANALGPPPEDVVRQAHAKGVLVSALAGRADHALSHKQAG